MQPDRHDALPPAQDEPAGTPAAENDAAQVDLQPTVEEQLRAAELKAAEHHDAWLRAKAEAENIRKRAQEDVAKAHKFGIERFATDLLAVKDSLEAALAAESANVENMRGGVELTLRQLESAFEKQQLREINPVGEKFDPHRHQAISTLPSDKEPNTVINVLQKGYSLSDRVIRPALVTVAKPKDA
ncbi:MAG TPA: nucleotide exchange factor GrpE [Burkholderiales bacterium]|jgi:molecular chaperone GrpE|nr:nucleotide exchange factor GrpE [Burkholderiales bacterium]